MIDVWCVLQIPLPLPKNVENDKILMWALLPCSSSVLTILAIHPSTFLVQFQWEIIFYIHLALQVISECCCVKLGSRSFIMSLLTLNWGGAGNSRNCLKRRMKGGEHLQEALTNKGPLPGSLGGHLTYGQRPLPGRLFNFWYNDSSLPNSYWLY